MLEVDLIKNIDFIVNSEHYFYNSGADGWFIFSAVDVHWVRELHYVEER
jgi:hypothetical protein